jgi:hypothetical protein
MKSIPPFRNTAALVNCYAKMFPSDKLIDLRKTWYSFMTPVLLHLVPPKQSVMTSRMPLLVLTLFSSPYCNFSAYINLYVFNFFETVMCRNAALLLTSHLLMRLITWTKRSQNVSSRCLSGNDLSWSRTKTWSVITSPVLLLRWSSTEYRESRSLNYAREEKNNRLNLILGSHSSNTVYENMFFLIWNSLYLIKGFYCAWPSKAQCLL